MRQITINKIAKKKCAIFSPKIDNRDGSDEKGVIVTHDKQCIEAIKCSTVSDILTLAKEYDVIGIDEAQFFTDIREACETLRRDGKIVIVAMLNCDYQTNPFDALNIICIADSVKYLKAVCVSCYSPAIYSYRTTTSHDLIEIGGADKYKALCYQCFDDEHNKISN